MAKQLVFRKPGGQFYVQGGQHAKSLCSRRPGLFSDSRAGYICVSLDETRVYFVLHEQHWLVRNGKTEDCICANNDSLAHRH